jgi:hypothetical protein
MDENTDVIYIFLHMPKSAGTTFRHHIENNFSSEEILGLYHADRHKLTRDDVFAKVSAFSVAQKQKLRVVYGHEVYYGVHELLDRPSRYVTFLRDPIEKTISFYNYRMQQGIRKKQIDEAHLPSFEEWLQGSPGMHDGMLGDLVKYGFADGYDVSEPSLRAIVDKFYFIGTTESFDDDALFLYHEMGVRRFFRDQNKSQRYLSPADLERVRPLITEKTPLDRRVYEHAVAWNREFKSRHKAFAGIVAKMKLKRALTKGVQQLLPG